MFYGQKNLIKKQKKICKYLKNKFNIEKLAVIITDSHTVPLRYGTIGISTGFYGLKPLKNYIGKSDIFGRKMKMSRSNIVDAIATIGVFAIGEGDEQTPMCIIRDVKDSIEFTEKETYNELIIPIKKDIYFPLLKNFYKKY